MPATPLPPIPPIPPAKREAGARPARSARSTRPAPPAVLALLALTLLLQVGWQASRPAPAARARDLPPAPSLAALRLAALGEPVALSKATMLYLQGYDDQAGLNLAWRQLDYANLALWLQRVLELDPRGQYPLLAASQVYGAVSDPARTRLMLDFVYARFAEDPERRWPWLAHAALVARHRLHDLPLARRYAAAIRVRATGAQVPAWARELELFMAEDMDQLAAARALIGGLLEDGLITDPHELKFLAARLEQLEQLEQREKTERSAQQRASPLPARAPQR